MSKDLSIRDALLELRQFVAGDAERKNRIADLTSQLNEAVNDRVAAAESVVETWTKLTGFNGDFDSALVGSGSVKTTKKKTTKKKVTKKKRRKKRVTKKASTAVARKKTRRKKRRTVRQKGKPLGWPGQMDLNTQLAPAEQKLVDLLVERWPLFTPATMLVNRGLMGKTNQAGASINRLRNKGVPVESAKQARANDPDVQQGVTGYRLFAAAD
jgi:hypothetical protein